MREMELDDIFLSRLQLLVIMAKAYLNQYPLGEFRQRSILENAALVQIDAEGLAEDASASETDEPDSDSMDFKPVFYRRIKLLTVMAEAFAKGHALEDHKREALEHNLESICEAITFRNKLSEMQFLKVA
jgi:hypothetical protein